MLDSKRWLFAIKSFNKRNACVKIVLNKVSDIFFDLFGVLIDYKYGEIQTLSNIQLLNKLNKKYSLWIISNTSNQQINEFKNKFDFFYTFKGIITSETAKYSKPDHRIFNYALNKADASAYSSLFIDDSLSNINSAKELGFNTIHYNNDIDLEYLINEE